MPNKKPNEPMRFSPLPRREFFKTGVRTGAAVALGGCAALLAAKNRHPGHPAEAFGGAGTVWQIDPNRCVGCARCATQCVRDISAVKCFHNESLCGYCEICTGFFDEVPIRLDEGAENQICPTGAIARQKIEANYYEYQIDSVRCVGCGKCVRGCTDKGNGSMFLQIDQSLCAQCNQCAIAVSCPADAISRVAAATPYRFSAPH